MIFMYRNLAKSYAAHLGCMRAGSQRRILIPLYMAVIAESATTAMICTTWSQARALCGLLGIPSPLMFVSRLPSANNPKAPINMLDTSRSFQKVWGFKSFTRTHYSSAGIIPSRARGFEMCVCVWGFNFIPLMRATLRNARSLQDYDSTWRKSWLIRFYQDGASVDILKNQSRRNRSRTSWRPRWPHPPLPTGSPGTSLWSPKGRP